MLADHLSLHRCGVHAEPLREMEAKAQRIEERPAAHHAVVTGDSPREVGERIGRVGNHEEQRLGSRSGNPGNQVPIDRGVGAEQSQAARGIVAVGGAAAFFVGARCNHHHRGAAEVSVFAGPQGNGRPEDGSVLEVGDGALGAFVAAIDQNDLARRSAQCHGEHARCPDRTRADDADFHADR